LDQLPDRLLGDPRQPHRRYGARHGLNGNPGDLPHPLGHAATPLPPPAPAPPAPAPAGATPLRSPASAPAAPANPTPASATAPATPPTLVQTTARPQAIDSTTVYGKPSEMLVNAIT